MHDNKEKTEQTTAAAPVLNLEILAQIRDFQEDFNILEIEEIIEIFKDHFCIHNQLDTDARQAAIDIINKMKSICGGILLSAQA